MKFFLIFYLIFLGTLCGEEMEDPNNSETEINEPIANEGELDNMDINNPKADTDEIKESEANSPAINEEREKKPDSRFPSINEPQLNEIKENKF